LLKEKAGFKLTSKLTGNSRVNPEKEKSTCLITLKKVLHVYSWGKKTGCRNTRREAPGIWMSATYPFFLDSSGLVFLGLLVVWATASSPYIIYGSFAAAMLVTLLFGILRIKRIDRIREQRALQAKQTQSDSIKANPPGQDERISS
jgi:hypothetical protein